MNPKVYDGANILGVLLTSFGAGWFNYGAGFIVAGILIIALNLYNVKLLKGNK